jgi:hypothetical protein
MKVFVTTLASGLCCIGLMLSSTPGYSQSANQMRAEAHDRDTSEKAYILGCTAANATGAEVCDELPGSHMANERLAREREMNRQALEQRKEAERQRQYQRDTARRSQGR